MYCISKEEDDLAKIFELKNTLFDFAEKYPDIVTVFKLADLANALTLKLGGLRDSDLVSILQEKCY